MTQTARPGKVQHKKHIEPDHPATPHRYWQLGRVLFTMLTIDLGLLMKVQYAGGAGHSTSAWGFMILPVSFIGFARLINIARKMHRQHSNHPVHPVSFLLGCLVGAAIGALVAVALFFLPAWDIGQSGHSNLGLEQPGITSISQKM